MHDATLVAEEVPHTKRRALVRELWHVMVCLTLKVQFTAFPQLHRRDGSEGFGDGRPAKHRLPCHRQALLAVGHAVAIQVGDFSILNDANC